jgi:hypothetical protein
VKSRCSFPHGALGEHLGAQSILAPTNVVARLYKNGGAEGNRTPDLCVANVALSQLSYGPTDAENDRLQDRFRRFSACSTSLVDVYPRIIRLPESDVNRLVCGTRLEQRFLYWVNIVAVTRFHLRTSR